MRKSGCSWIARQVSFSLTPCACVNVRVFRRRPSPPALAAYFAVGITNSAPLPMLSGQRCMIDFCLV